MESQSDTSGNVTVSINPEEQVNITTKNQDTMTTQIIGLSEDNTSVITASGASIRIDEIIGISSPAAPRTARFVSGVVLAAGGLATTVAGGNKPNPPLTFTYINGIKVPLN
ncbi:hypothetical protein [Pseudomonas sp. 37 R 15]|jgi:hypothetical protein|uniref:hypothetical protein n=1 Tax=Pseudomonas sp. 37 R 15 TaxID=1844104 RepID=UPI000812B460|nr:hypothetical protein [Pseudomonas sp. 37 R 15]CRM72337.1 hypothetical protein [Pseudomonas sp. 37 R 15]